MKRKTLIRRKDIDCLFDRTEGYQARIGKIHEKREYDTVYQIVSKFHSMRRAVWNRCEKYGVKKCIKDEIPSTIPHLLYSLCRTYG